MRQPETTGIRQSPELLDQSVGSGGFRPAPADPYICRREGLHDSK